MQNGRHERKQEQHFAFFFFWNLERRIVARFFLLVFDYSMVAAAVAVIIIVMGDPERWYSWADEQKQGTQEKKIRNQRQSTEVWTGLDNKRKSTLELVLRSCCLPSDPSDWFQWRHCDASVTASNFQLTSPTSLHIFFSFHFFFVSVFKFKFA